jgi:TatA/E family protein of Tat protein translocase
MGFFGLSTGEVLIILLVILIVFGPQKLPELAKATGRALAEIRQATSGVRNAINEEIRNFDDETRAVRQGLAGALDDAKSAVKDAKTEIAGVAGAATGTLKGPVAEAKTAAGKTADAEQAPPAPEAGTGGDEQRDPPATIADDAAPPRPKSTTDAVVAVRPAEGAVSRSAFSDAALWHASPTAAPAAPADHNPATATAPVVSVADAFAKAARDAALAGAGANATSPATTDPAPAPDPAMAPTLPAPTTGGSPLT